MGFNVSPMSTRRDFLVFLKALLNINNASAKNRKHFMPYQIPLTPTLTLTQVG